jgi:predicted acyltransferase
MPMTIVGVRTGPAARLVSLDVFRGLTMAAMVIVNNPGDWANVYAPLLHAPWHGWTSTDLIFPFFLFIVGVSITLSRRTASTMSILKRGAIIFAFGLFLSAFPHFDPARVRIPGVLQRIALCYVAAALVFNWWRRHASVRAVLVLSAAILLGYWAIMMLVPPPGGAAGDLTAEGNLGAYIDRALMEGHLWKPRWDPEGLLSTIPAIATTLLGVVAGLWLSAAERGDGTTRHREATAGWLALAGTVAMGVGLLWDLVFPINKNLWTSSFVVFTGGAAAFVFACCYWIIDAKGWRGWTTPFVILGVNALALFILSGLFAKTIGRVRLTLDDGQTLSAARLVYVTMFQPIASPRNASLLYAFANLLLLFLVLWWMYRRKIILRA